MTKAKIKKLKSLFIDNLVNFHNSDKYHKYIAENPKYKTHVDNNSQISIWAVTFFDLVNNEEMNSIIKRTSSLNKSNFNKELNFKVPKRRTVNYFRLEYDSSAWTHLGKITFLKDKYINNLNIIFSQVNNNEAIV